MNSTPVIMEYKCGHLYECKSPSMNMGALERMRGTEVPNLHGRESSSENGEHLPANLYERGLEACNRRALKLKPLQTWYVSSNRRAQRWLHNISSEMLIFTKFKVFDKVLEICLKSHAWIGLCYPTKFDVPNSMQSKFPYEVVMTKYGSHSQGYFQPNSIERPKMSSKAE